MMILLERVSMPWIEMQQHGGLGGLARVQDGSISEANQSHVPQERAFFYSFPGFTARSVLSLSDSLAGGGGGVGYRMWSSLDIKSLRMRCPAQTLSPKCIRQ